MQYQWILDSRATNHVTPYVQLLSDVKSWNSQLYLPNGQMATVTHVGSIQLALDIRLESVLCVPSLTYNLLSISKLLSSSNSYITFNATCILQDYTKRRETEIGNANDGLYLLTPSMSSFYNYIKFSHPICHHFSSNSIFVELLHAKLGHIPLKVLKLLDVPRTMHELPTCDTCYIAKQHKMQLNNSSSESSSIFDLFMLMFGDHIILKPKVIVHIFLL